MTLKPSDISYSPDLAAEPVSPEEFRSRIGEITGWNIPFSDILEQKLLWGSYVRSSQPANEGAEGSADIFIQIRDNRNEFDGSGYRLMVFRELGKVIMYRMGEDGRIKYQVRGEGSNMVDPMALIHTFVLASEDPQFQNRDVLSVFESLWKECTSLGS